MTTYEANYFTIQLRHARARTTRRITIVQHGIYQIDARSQRFDGAVLHLSGEVVFETDSLTLRADTVNFNENSKEIQARGNVTLKLK